MRQFTYTFNEINRETLNDQLTSALESAYGGFTDRQTSDGYQVVINLLDSTTQSDVDTLNRVMTSYDPAVLTPRQQAEQQRQAKLADLRETRSRSFDPADYNGENALIQALAQQLAWLEQEVIDLRGGSDEL